MKKKRGEKGQKIEEMEGGLRKKGEKALRSTRYFFVKDCCLVINFLFIVNTSAHLQLPQICGANVNVQTF